MRKPFTIYCPNCQSRIMRYNGRGIIPIDKGCENCRKRIVYFPTIDEIRVTDIPKRKSSSGTRFWF